MGNTRYEINVIRNELNQVVNELNNIADELNRNFKGIGSENCANCLEKVADQYAYVIKKINTIDENKIAEEYGGVNNG